MGVEGLGTGFKMNETTGKPKIRVGDGASRVVAHDEEARDLLWPFNMPQDRNIGVLPLPRLDSVSWEPNSSGAFSRGIGMTFFQGGQRYEIGYTSGAGFEVLCYPLEVVESLVGSFAEVDSVLALGSDHILEAPVHVACSWYGDSHGPQFYEDDVSLVHAGAPLVLGDAVNDLPQPLDTVGRQVDHHADGVQNPDKD